MKGPLSDILRVYSKMPIKVIQLAAVELSARVYDDTPVDTGLLQSSWTPSLNSPDNSNSGGSFPAVANQLNKGDSYYVVNAQPYARRIEYEGWSHTKAPNGMLRINVVKWPSIVRWASQKVKSGS